MQHYMILSYWRLISCSLSGKRTSSLQLLLLFLLLLSLCQDLAVLSSSKAGLLLTSPLNSNQVSSSLQDRRSNKTLNLGRLVLLGLSFLQRLGSFNDVLAHIIFPGQVEKLADLGGTLGSKSSWDGVVGQAGNFSLALLDDTHGNYAHVSVNNTSPHRLAFPLSLPAGTVA